MKKSHTTFIFLVLTFIIAYFGRKIFFPQGLALKNYLINTLFSYSWWLVPPIAFVIIRYGRSNLFELFGLNKEFLKALKITFIASLPMILGYAFFGDIKNPLNYAELFHKTVLAATMEEFLFRGFLFGILFRNLGWGFIPAAILGALIFGLGHVYQGDTMTESLGVFGITLMGGLLFSWLYVEWEYNLWVPICMHFFMNLAWMVFDVSTNAMGGTGANVFRFLSIALIIIITVINAKRRGYFNIKKSNFLLNHTN